MKKIMISQPMRGKTDEEIKEVRNRFLKFAEKNNYEVVNTLFSKDWVKENLSKDVKNIPVFFLAKSIEKMSLCDTIYFAKGWENARGCLIEYMAARQYNIEIICER